MKASLYYNGHVVTVDPAERIAEAFVVRDGRFLAVGSSREILQGFGADAEKHDLEGRTVIPGLNDSHAHPIPSSVTEVETPIPVLSTIAGILAWVKAETSRRPRGEWIYVHRIYPARIREWRLPSRAELDAAAPDHPVFLCAAFTGHVNSPALKVSGITRNTAHPGVYKDPSTGEPTGILHRSAHPLLVHRFKEDYPPSERKRLLSEMLARYNAVGLTSLTETPWHPGDWALIKAMAAEKSLTARLYANYHVIEVSDGPSAERAAAVAPMAPGSGDEWLRMGPFKIFVDGGLLTATAYLSEPWCGKARLSIGMTDPRFRGARNFSLEKMTDMVRAAAGHGFGFIGHATGDGAVDLLLSAYERAGAKSPVKGRRFTLLHGNFFSAPALARCKALDAVLDVQPAWLYKDLDALSAVLPESCMADFHPYRDILDKGLLFCSGSDHMAKLDADSAINPYNPFIGMVALTARRSEQGTPAPLGQALTRMEALKSYTLNNAVKSGEEGIKGSIEKGRLADFVILEKDLLSCGEEELLKMRVLATFLGGREVYRASPVYQPV
jgi:predicted amidohydrolase YtcJ